MKQKGHIKKPILTKFARKNRSTPTKGENILWNRLRNRQLNDLKFKRQFVINEFIVDFYCAELKLIVEIDGSSHEGEVYEKDVVRQRNLEKLGFKFLRFTEWKVLNEIYEALETIDYTARQLSTSSGLRPPSPSQEKV